MTEDCVKKNLIFFYSTTLETLKFYHLTLKNSFGPQLVVQVLNAAISHSLGVAWRLASH